MGNSYKRLRAFEDFAIDLDRKVLWINETPVDLPFKAVEMLCVLVERDGAVVTREELLDELWGDTFVEESVLTQNVYVLRKAFKKYGFSKNLIETIPRRGYRFAGRVHDVADEFELTIERQTVERSFIAEAEWSEEEKNSLHISRANRISTPGSRRAPYSRNTIYAVSVLGLLAAVGLVASIWAYNARNSQRIVVPADDSRKELVYDRLSDSGRVYYVGLSADDQIAAYVTHTGDDKYSLTLINLATGSKTVVVPPQSAHIHNIVFSPDGNYIYYAAQIDDKPMTAYRIPIYGGQSEAIASNFVHQFSISPDGNWLAFYTSAADETVNLEICRSKDGGDRKVVTSRSENESFNVWGKAPEWSPEGKRLVAAASVRKELGSPWEHMLLEIDLDSGSQKRIASPKWYRIAQPYWESDGKGFFVMARENKGDPVQIWHLDYPSGEARKISDNKYEFREFRPSSDASFFVATTWNTNSNLYLIGGDGLRDVEQLTFDSDVLNGEYGLKWSPDEKQIVYVRVGTGSVGNLWVLDLETKKHRQLTFDEDSMQNYVDVTPDGRSAVFGSNRNGRWNVWKIDLDGKNLKQLTFGKKDAAPEISPDGQWLYYVNEGLWKMPLEGGEPVRIMKDIPGTTRVSPTDPHRLISFFKDPEELEKDPWKFILYAEENPKAFTDLDLDAITVFEWKPDGSGIYFGDKGESFSNLWFLSLEDGKKTRLTAFGDQKISNFSLSPDGKTFVVARGQVTGRVFKISGFKSDG